MAIFGKGNGGLDSIREYYDKLKVNEWKGISSNPNQPYYGPGSKQRHATDMLKLGGIYMLRTFRTTVPRLYTVAKNTVAPILNTTTLGKTIRRGLSAYKVAQSFGAPDIFTTSYPDIPLTSDNPVKRVTTIFSGGGKSDSLEIRKRYGLGYNTLDGIPGYENHGMYNEFQSTYETSTMVEGDAEKKVERTESNPFTFNDLVPVIIGGFQFRGLIAGFADTLTPTWNATTYIGRPDPMMSYAGFTREIAFDLTVAATRPEHLRPMWEKINNMCNYVLPQQDTMHPNTRYNGRLCELTVGDYIKDEMCVMTGVTIAPSEDAHWEINDPELDYPSRTLHPGHVATGKKLINKYKTAKEKRKIVKAGGTVEEEAPETEKRYIMPRVVTISLTFGILHNRVPVTDSTGKTLNRLFNHEGYTDDMSININA